MNDKKAINQKLDLSSDKEEIAKPDLKRKKTLGQQIRGRLKTGGKIALPTPKLGRARSDRKSWESMMDSLISNDLNGFVQKMRDVIKDKGKGTGQLKDFLNYSDPKEGHTFLSLLAFAHDTDPDIVKDLVTYTDIVEDLVKLGADLDQATPDKRTPLIEAIKVGNTERALHFIKLGADFNKVGDALGKTVSPLIAALDAAIVDEELVDAILDQEYLQINYRDSEGMSALDYAKETGNKRIIEKVQDKIALLVLKNQVDKKIGFIQQDIQNNLVDKKEKKVFFDKQLSEYKKMINGRNVNLFEMKAIMVCLIQVHHEIAKEAGIYPPKLDEQEAEIITELGKKNVLKRITQLASKYPSEFASRIRKIGDELKEKLVDVKDKAKTKAAFMGVMRGEAGAWSADQRKSVAELEKGDDIQFQAALKQILGLAEEIKKQDIHISDQESGLEKNITSIKKQKEYQEWSGSKKHSFAKNTDQERAFRAIDKLDNLLKKAIEANESNTAPLVWKRYCKGEVRRHLEKMAKEPIKSAFNSLLQAQEDKVSKRVSKQ